MVLAQVDVEPGGQSIRIKLPNNLAISGGMYYYIMLGGEVLYARTTKTGKENIKYNEWNNERHDNR